ncbi:GGDEF domain-containing protein [Luteimonas sp BLCC-B24]|uniref:GGDEF domain-containing protein n=1 Tax=Luteimonas sp. BLCC-B24 TaxID=3025317 RepID=UPI00234CAD90|nr:GGDEF domain-containing protein [Luteimonas sp. BLCC-B24]MDC7807269.1 GGDEF domain-containing protein [Luteimonas sp. BLCC-B24]
MGINRSRRRARSVVLATPWLCMAIASAAPPAPAPVPAIADTVGRCFELRDRAPADAIALVHAALTTPGLTADDEIKLLACRIRAEALSGSAGAVIATADRIETRLQDEPRPPEFVLRALSNAGAALHTVGQVPRALALYRRAYEAAEAGESDLAQVKMLINVGSIQSEYLQAYALAETTFEQAATIGARSGVFDPLLPYNRGLNFLRMGDAARAGRQFETALASEQVTDTVLARRLRAEQLALARGADAETQLRAIAEIQSTDDPSGAALTYVRVSGVARAAGRYDAAIESAERAIALATAGGFARERRDAQRARVEALHAAGRFEAAFAALTQLHADEQDALRRQNLDALAELQARLEDGRTLVELERLRETQRIDVLNARHARTLRDVGAAALLLLVLLALAFALYQRRISRRLRRLSATDSLTGLLNRRAVIAAMQALPAPPSPTLRHVVFLIDVDHFKRSNDVHGHGTGDAILVELAQRFTAACRPGDLVARWGGEEFLVVCRGLDRSQAAAIAERLRVAIAERPVMAGGVAIALTVSIGFACRPQPTSAAGWHEAIDLADHALYAAKRGGRDGWVGLWSDAATDLQQGLRDPQAAVADGRLQAWASRQPIIWSGARATEASTGDGAAVTG